MGTPSYMSPEQARSLPSNERTDIYAVGCMLFKMISGQVPAAAPGSPSVRPRGRAGGHRRPAARACASAPGKLEELSRAAYAARNHANDLEGVRALRHLAHVLRGTAGSFGFPGVSLAAGRIEDAAERLLDEPASAGRESDAEIDAALCLTRGALGAGG
jgi:serine/threonine protein kinase